MGKSKIKYQFQKNTGNTTVYIFNVVNDYCNNRRQPSLIDLFKIGELLKIDPKDLLNTKKS